MRVPHRKINACCKGEISMTNSLEKILKRTEWFREDRFGMFIHWGLYAIPGRGE